MKENLIHWFLIVQDDDSFFCEASIRAVDILLAAASLAVFLCKSRNNSIASIHYAISVQVVDWKDFPLTHRWRLLKNFQTIYKSFVDFTRT